MDSKRQMRIEDVAIYLRKSRGDIDIDLEKHRLLLIERCKDIGANYVEYAEIGTSDSIDDRPAFMELLEDIKLNLFDAVAVSDIDRLGRGGDKDWALIEEIFRNEEIYIITPEKVFNWDDESDEMELDFRKFIARMEYKQTTKRLRRGKIMGAKQGRWTNGTPPYPYTYNRQTRQLDIDNVKYKVYRRIVEMALEGVPANKISWELNRLGIPSPRGKKWTNVAVYRLLRDKTHLGKIVFAKQEGSGHKNRNTRPLKTFSEDEWIVIDGLHQPIKTQDEHRKIMELLAKRRIVPKAARSGAFVLSGLVYCRSCGYSMGNTRNGISKKEFLKKCQTRDSLGNRTCNNPGVNSYAIVKGIFQQLDEYEREIKKRGEDMDTNETGLLKVALTKKHKEIEKQRGALDTLIEMREEQEITREKFLERKEIREFNIAQLRNEIGELQDRINQREQTTNERKLKNIREFRDKWGKSKSSEQRNQFLQTIIDRIDYQREGDNIDIHINFR
ncbi:MAG: recombinase family protein [Clostridiales bacterium]|nr:recombinase family protein [Clostridiales bacterium]